MSSRHLLDDIDEVRFGRGERSVRRFVDGEHRVLELRMPDRRMSTAHARKQFEALTAQTKELTALAQKVASETAEPIKEGVGKVFKHAA